MNIDPRELLENIRESGADSLLVAKRSNIRYLSGLGDGPSYAAVTQSGISLFVNALAIEEIRATAGEGITVRETGEDVRATFAALGESFWGGRIGYEADAITCAFLGKFTESVTFAEPVPCEGIVERFRECKHPHEVEAIRNAQRIAEAAYRDSLTLLREGIEERELAMEIDYRLRKLGGERTSFDTIVAFGPNSSKPHATPSARKLVPGDLVLVDMGTIVDGYASDMTRTLVFGKADDRQREVYRAVLAAQKAAIDATAPGVECAEVDRIARESLEHAGFGKEFVHSLGHGVGLEIHENPRLSRTSKETLKPGQVVTIEPGVYLPGWGGVRIEDMVLVTGDGCENLTTAGRELMEND
jgi:Xaa-Pro aminopeptidase